MNHRNVFLRQIIGQIIGFVFRDLAVGRTDIQSSLEGHGSFAPGALVRQGSHVVPGIQRRAKPLASPKESITSQKRASGLVPMRKRRQRLQLEETQEQAVAVARGGVRYAGKVFHRKGVKLTEDSPRSMLPRNVSGSIQSSRL